MVTPLSRYQVSMFIGSLTSLFYVTENDLESNPSNNNVSVTLGSEEGSLFQYHLTTTWDTLKCVSDHGDVRLAPERT